MGQLSTCTIVTNLAPDPEFPRGGPIMWPNFPENGMKMRKVEPRGRGRQKCVYLDPQLQFFRKDFGCLHKMQNRSKFNHD